MTFKSIFIALTALTMSVAFTSCDKGEDDNGIEIPASDLSAPTLDKNLTTTTYGEASFRVRFTNGGDTNENMSCKVHWRSYYSKQSITPTASDMTEHETMSQYGGGTETKTTFDKTHAGLSGGTYLYYYFECSNSRHTTESKVTYCVVKR